VIPQQPTRRDRAATTAWVLLDFHESPCVGWRSATVVAFARRSLPMTTQTISRWFYSRAEGGVTVVVHEGEHPG
jgi:hypothetical protein